MVDDIWLEAAAAVAADADADMRREAAEVYAAEAARTRLLDLRGQLRVQVRCGQVLTGRKADDEPIGAHLVLTSVQQGAGVASVLVVPVDSVVAVDGSTVELRDESEATRPRTLSSWLRERWGDGEVLRILDRTGRTHVGALALVAADHVRLESGRVIALHAVDAWGT